MPLNRYDERAGQNTCNVLATTAGCTRTTAGCVLTRPLQLRPEHMVARAFLPWEFGCAGAAVRCRARVAPSFFSSAKASGLRDLSAQLQRHRPHTFPVCHIFSQSLHFDGVCLLITSSTGVPKSFTIQQRINSNDSPSECYPSISGRIGAQRCISIRLRTIHRYTNEIAFSRPQTHHKSNKSETRAKEETREREEEAREGGRLDRAASDAKKDPALVQFCDVSVWRVWLWRRCGSE